MIMRTCLTCGTAPAPNEKTCPEGGGMNTTDDVGEAAELLRALKFEEEGVPVARALPDEDAVHVDVRVRPEFASAPRTMDPMMSLLVDLTPSGPPIVRAGGGPVAHVILLLDV